MKKKDIGMMLTAVVRGAVLLGTGVPAQAAEPPAGTMVQAEALKVSSYKGNSLAVGDRSMVVISPYGTSVTAVSSNPEVIALEQVRGWHVMAAKAPGTAEIRVTDEAGHTASVTVTVGGEPASAPKPEAVGSDSAQAPADVSPVVNSEWSHNPDADLTSNMEIRLEMVRLINQVRLEHGLTELPTDESLMNAAQDVSSQCVTEHRPYDHMALLRYGWPHGGLYNLTMFTAYGCPDVARQAIDYWIASPGHYETMLLAEASHVGTGVTFKNGKAYCYMVVGDPTSHNPYE